MKKMIFSAAAFGLVAVSSIALAPTTAEAIPAFARQTGAACLSCHFQTFPAVNSFGRAFKMGSFTDVGDEALVEDDALSIPASLNATVVIRGNYTRTSTTAAGVKTTTGNWNVPSETPILIAGRVGSNSGAFVEFANGGAGAGPAGAGAPVSVGNWQFMNSFDLGGFKVGVSAANSTFGGSAQMEYSNVFGQHSGKLAGGNVSAIQALGFAQATVGVGAWVGNDMGNIQLALIAPSAAQGTNVGTSFGKLVRGAATLDLAGWDTLIGFGVVTGTAGKSVASGGVGQNPMDLQFVDAQFQGAVGDTSIGVYADWAHAKGKTDQASLQGNVYGVTNGPTNLINIAGTKSDAYSIRADIKPLEHVIVGAGYGYNKFSTPVAASISNTKTTQVAATYEIYQNFEINGVYTSAKTTTGGVANTTNTTLLEFEALM